MNLYELTNEMQALNELLEEEGGEVTDGTALAKWMDEYGLAMKGKVDGYGALIKNLDSYTDSLKLEEKRLYDRRKVFENRIARLKDMAGESMRRLGVKKLEGERFTLTICASGGKQAMQILDEKGIPEMYLDIIPQKLVVNSEKVRAGLEAGNGNLEGKAVLMPRGEYVKIK